MEWRIFKDDPPGIGDFIAAIRDPFPSYYWIGTYKGVPSEEEDIFTLWIPLPIPKETGELIQKVLENNEDVHRSLLDICQGDASKIISFEQFYR